jgi:hypothetical protein
VSEKAPNGSSDADTYLYGVSCNSGGLCTSAGYATKTLTSAPQTLAESWTGSAWKLETTPNA